MSGATAGAALRPGVPNPEKDAKIIAWVENHFGGKVTRCETQPRWRGGWWVDVVTGDGLRKLYVREEREQDYPPWPLEHEAGIMQVLERHGIPVPHIHGICADPHATVMDVLEGGFDFSAMTEAEEAATLEHLADIWARMHAIDPGAFAGVGLAMPQGPRDIALPAFRELEALYLNARRRPDPWIEFLRKWVHDHVPAGRTRASLVQVDAGQFLASGGRVLGLYDFEYACLGDPLGDIAFIPFRLANYKARDSRPFLRRYAQLTGERLDREVLAFHAVRWGLCTPFIMTADLHQPGPNAAYVEYVRWYLGGIIAALGILGDLMGLDLPMDYPVPAPQPSRWGAMIGVMAARLPAATAGEPYAVSQDRGALALLARCDAQRGVEDGYVRDVARLTGAAPADWAEADAALEAFVLASGPEHEAELVRLLHRWSVTQMLALFDPQTPKPWLAETWPRLSRLVD